MQGGSVLKRLLPRFSLRATDTPLAAAAALILCALFAGRQAQAETLQLESNETLFCVMAAVNAAGYDEGIDLPDNNPLRRKVRDYLATLNLPVLPELKKYYRRHMQRAGTDDLSQYVSWAFAVNGAPDFAWKGRDVEVPPDALALDGFQPLMIDFYRQAKLADLWKQVQPAYQAEMVRYHKPILAMTGSVDAYLRSSVADFPGRKFHAIVEPLMQPQVIQTRSYGDDTYVVISPAENPPMYDIRHAYIFSLIDPLMLTYRTDIQEKRSLLDLVGNAPMPDEYKFDMVLLCSQSLVKAVEARLDKDKAAVDRAARQGYIMTPFFYEQLPAFEKQQQSMRFYADEMINAIDLNTETMRLSTVKFDAAPLQRTAKKVQIAAPEPELSPAGKTLRKAESLFTARNEAPDNLQESKKLFIKALEQKGEPAERAQAWYGMARIAMLEKKGSTAQQLFEKTLESSPDDFVRGWADVQLGSIYRSQQDFAHAIQYYKDALAVSGASEKAKQTAQSELNAISQSQEKQIQ
jgi:hypothetical protein